MIVQPEAAAGTNQRVSGETIMGLGWSINPSENESATLHLIVLDVEFTVEITCANGGSCRQAEVPLTTPRLRNHIPPGVPGCSKGKPRTCRGVHWPFPQVAFVTKSVGALSRGSLAEEQANVARAARGILLN